MWHALWYYNTSPQPQDTCDIACWAAGGVYSRSVSYNCAHQARGSVPASYVAEQLAWACALPTAAECGPCWECLRLHCHACAAGPLGLLPSCAAASAAASEASQCFLSVIASWFECRCPQLLLPARVPNMALLGMGGRSQKSLDCAAVDSCWSHSETSCLCYTVTYINSESSI